MNSHSDGIAPIRAPDQAEVKRARPVISRGAVSLVYDPPEVFVGVVRVPLSPSEIAVIDLLMKRGCAATDRLETALRAVGSAPYHLPVFLHRIRRKFRRHAGVDPIRTIRGWGLELRPSAPAGPPRLMIGERRQLDDVRFVDAAIDPERH